MPFDPAQVYSPAEDTFLLLKAARHEARPSDRAIEIGSGNGLIAVAHAHALGIDVIRTDLCAGLSGSFTLIVFNPPYLPTQPDERIGDWLEYALDGGVSGRAVIERFAADAGRVLAPAGRILLLISSLTGLAEVSGLFLSNGYSVTVVQEQRVEDETLYVLRIA
jgi:release factor glutamine methyltransferase